MRKLNVTIDKTKSDKSDALGVSKKRFNELAARISADFTFKQMDCIEVVERLLNDETLADNELVLCLLMAGVLDSPTQKEIDTFKTIDKPKFTKN